MCTVLLPPGVNPIAVNKYVSNHIHHIASCITSYIISYTIYRITSYHIITYIIYIISYIISYIVLYIVSYIIYHIYHIIYLIISIIYHISYHIIPYIIYFHGRHGDNGAFIVIILPSNFVFLSMSDSLKHSDYHTFYQI